MVYAEKNVGFYLACEPFSAPLHENDPLIRSGQIDLLPTCVFLLCPLVMWYGKSRYTLTPPSGSVLGTSLRIIRFAAKGNWGKPKYLSSEAFWDKAKPSSISPDSRPAWMTFDDGKCVSIDDRGGDDR